MFFFPCQSDIRLDTGIPTQDNKLGQGDEFGHELGRADELDRGQNHELDWNQGH